MTPAEKLMRWLPPGLERAYGQYNPVSKEHHFINRPLTLQQYEDHITGIRSLGVVPIDENGEVSWAAIDIDTHKNDKTKPPVPWSNQQYKKLLDKIKFLKLPLTVVKSKGGGAHCILSLGKKYSAKTVQDLMKVFEYALGYEGLEIFPKQTELGPNDCGSFLNLPYFKGNSRNIINFDYKELNIEGLDYALKRTVKLPPQLKFFLLKQGTRTQHRNDRTWCAAAFLKKEYPDQWEEKTKEYNQLFNEPPLGEAHGEKSDRLESTVLKSHRNNEYNSGENKEEEPPNDFWEESEGFEKATNGKSKIPKLEIITGDSIFFSEDIPVNWTIENILPEGMCVLAALPKIGKSWLALQIAIAVENALEVLGFKVKQGRVLYFAKEDNKKRIKRRFKMNGVKPEDKKPSFVYKSCYLLEGLEEQIEDWIKETPDARLVIIDTYIKVVSPKLKRGPKNAYEVDSQNLSGLQRIALDYNITIIIIHHTKKGKEDDIYNEISGSTGIQGIADTLWVIESSRKVGQDSIFHITGRDVEGIDYQIGLDVNCKWLNKGRPGENKETEDQKQIIKAIKELDKGDGVYPREVVAHLKLTDKTEIGNIQKRMRRMLEKNELAVGQKGGQYKNMPF